MKQATRVFVLLVFSAAVLVACQAGSASTLSSSTQQTPTQAAPRPLPDPPGCLERPNCSIVHDQRPPEDPLQVELRCGPLYRYDDGGMGGDQGLGTFCPDSPENRALLHAHGKHGYLPGYCQSCLGVPPDKVFVFWRQFEQPSCPSGCPPKAPPF